MSIKEAAGWLASAKKIAVLTGAGVSSESGIPTFRDKLTGLWEGYDPHKLATPEGFLADPPLVWKWYDWRRHIVEGAEPNAGHLALAELEKIKEAEGGGHSLILVTQNVDRLHQRAGSKNVIELHGNIMSYRCFQRRHPADYVPPGLPEPPLCHCGSPLRPEVVWFGEALPQQAITLANDAAVSCDAFLVVGTSGLVQPAASLPYIAMEGGAKVIEVNPNRTPLSDTCDAFLSGSAGEILPLLLTFMKEC